MKSCFWNILLKISLCLGILFITRFAGAVDVDNWLDFRSNVMAGNSVVLTGNFTITSDDDDWLYSYKNLTIDGDGHYISGTLADGAQPYEFYTVNTGEVLIKNLTVKDFRTLDSIGNLHIWGSTVTLQNVTFTGNSSGDPAGHSASAYLAGATLANQKYIPLIKDSIFENNYIKLGSAGVRKNFTGGAIYSEGTIDLITGTTFKKNALELTYDGNPSTGWFQALGGALYNQGDIDTIENSSFDGNTSTTIHINGTSATEVWSQGGAIYNSGTINLISGATFTNNISSGTGGSYTTSYVSGGAIANEGTIGEIVNSTFINNSVNATGPNTVAYGGAISSDDDIKITANNGFTSEFSSNTAMVNGVTYSDGVYMYSSTTILTLNTETSGVIMMNDDILGAAGYTLKITGDGSGQVILNNTVKNANVILESGLLNLENNGALSGLAFTVQGGSFSLQNGVIGATNLSSLNLAGDANILVDVDLTAKTMDTLNATVYTGAGILTVSDIRIIADTEEENTTVHFASDEIKGQVVSEISKVSYSPTSIYNVTYDNTVGDFSFNKTKKANPYIYSENVASQNIGIIQNTIMSTVMENVSQKILSNAQGLSSGEGDKSGSVWIRSSGFKDTVKFKDFENVDTRYGLYALGYTSDESDLWELGAHYTAFGGYINGLQEYTNTNTRQDGFYGGAAAQFNTGNFFFALGADTGILNNKTNNMYGTDNHKTFWLGTALKVGYIFDIEDIFILSPTIYSAYTFIRPDDYTSVSGARIDNDNINLLEFIPGVNISKNFASWTVKASALYAITDVNDGEVKADSLVLPVISAKNYIEYGFGVAKEVTDSFQVDFNLNRRDGGRRGWNVSLLVNYRF